MQQIVKSRLYDKVRNCVKYKFKGYKLDSDEVTNSFMDFINHMEPKEVEKYISSCKRIAHIEGIKDFASLKYEKLAFDACNIYLAQQNHKRSYIKDGKIVIKDWDYIKDDFEEQEEEDLPSIEDLY